MLNNTCKYCKSEITFLKKSWNKDVCNRCFSYSGNHKAPKNMPLKEKKSSGTEVAVKSMALGSAFSMAGVTMMVLGGLLTITIIGAIIGIPLLIIGLITFLLAGVIGGGGILAGSIRGISNILRNRKSKKK